MTIDPNREGRGQICVRVGKKVPRIPNARIKFCFQFVKLRPAASANDSQVPRWFCSYSAGLAINVGPRLNRCPRIGAGAGRINREYASAVINKMGPASWPAYEKPPILEASFTIQIAPLIPERYALLGLVRDKLGPKFTKTQLLSEFNNKFLDVSGAATGMVYTSTDEKESVQARSDGFSYSRQAPYEGWDAFLPGVQGAWEAFKAVVSPVVPRQISVKYVNSITFPLGVPLRELFNTYPAAPDPNQLFDAISMFYRVSLSEVPGLRLSVRMTNLPIGDSNGHMLLDNTFQFATADERQIWPLMPLLRKIKNDIFESQLMPVLKDKFK